MARLLRVHFSSIGHKDARLAPLTLDFRHEGSERGSGTGADTVIWLRNGGGKSSILNLFYSVFRPSAREFLGASAEGKSRRLEQYVKGRDLAFVVTEWDVEAPAELTLFAREPARVRVVGQMLAWKHQRSSSDTSNLRRLFFSLLTHPTGVRFDTLPIQGLGDPVDSFDAFREWLRDAQHRGGATEVVDTDHQQRWQTHLEEIGLDPELFRYQLAMNQREGAADEVFRFRRDEEFVRFLLDLAFDPRHADRIATNLEAQRDNLRERPRWELERQFVGDALEQMRPLVHAAEALTESSRRLDELTGRMAGTVAALALRALDHGRAADEARTKADDARERARIADNERTKKLRWSRGLERLALQFDEEEARAKAREAGELYAEATRELRTAKAAGKLRALRTIDGELRELHEALARAEAELEPLRRAARERGSLLRALLTAEHERMRQLVDQLAQLEVTAEQAERDARRREREARDRIVARKAEIESLDKRVAQRERVRERLLADGHLERRELAAEGIARWKTRERELSAAQAQATSERDAASKRLRGLQERKTALAAERATHQARAAALGERVDKAYRWRDRLRLDPGVLEVEGVDEANVESPGLEARLRHRAEVVRGRVLDSRVEGAQDQRSLVWLRDHGLLPSPLDVRRVVEALGKQGIAAHAGPAYLEQNAPVELRRELLLHDPARFAGVVVLDETSLGRARQLEVTGLHTPVMVSVITDLTPGPSPALSVVLSPDAALYDAAAADERRPLLERAVARRDDEERRLNDEASRFGRLADDLARFLGEHGGGKLDALDRDLRAAQQQARLAELELQRIDEDHVTLRRSLEEIEAHLQRLAKDQEAARTATTAIQRFIDEHDAEIEAVRSRKDAATQELQVATTEAERADTEAKERRENAKEHQRRKVEQEASARQITKEHDSVEHHGEPCAAPAELTLDAARAGYETARKQYEGEITAHRIKAELEQKSRQRATAKNEYDKAANGLDSVEVDRLATRADLDEETHRLEEAEREQLQAEAHAKAHHAQVKAKLDESNRKRREADDLPADSPRPSNASAARQQATELEAQAERDADEHRRAVAESQDYTSEATTQGGHAKHCEALADTLRSVAQGAHIDLPEANPMALGQDPEELDRTVAQLKTAFTASKREREDAQQTVNRRAEGVRRIANASRYTELRARYQERMKEATDVLLGEAATLTASLETRLEVIGQALAKLDEDRRLIVEQLLHVADQIAKLLERAERSSRLPATIEGWAGRPYLRIKFKFPDTDEEKRSLLAPLVDRLVEQAQIPGGVELVFRTALELAGGRGFDVQILKPDAEPRPDPIPIHQMSTFSRGQQLTAAIVLYCTLVQLRARSRGRDHGSEDAGVLILDNPIGTCSNVALMRLQRTIAAQMRVQLIYTTGVDDLEALEILPNKIRLRNTHRDRATGDYHVTEDEPDLGKVEGVRLVEVPAR